MRAGKHLARLRTANRMAKAATPGERVIGSLNPVRGSGYPGYWGAERLEQVLHFKNWVFVYIDTIATKIASLTPNMAAVVDSPQPGRTVKANQRGLLNAFGRGFRGGPYIGGGMSRLSSWETPKATRVAGTYVGAAGYDPQAPVGFSGAGHSWLTQGEYRSKALSVVEDHEELEPLEPSHPLVRLMRNPNPVDTCFDVEYELQMFEELCGVSYEWTPKNALGVPCERWCIPSHWVYPRTGGGEYAPYYAEFSQNLVWDYEIRPYGYPGYAGVLHFPPDEVIVTRWKTPLSKLDGHSKLRAGSQWVDEEEGISTSRWAQMGNRAASEMIVEMPPGYNDPDDPMVARVEAKFMQRVQGPFNFGKPLLVPGGTRITPYSFSPAEMAYFESENQIRDMLGSLWRVPKAAVGITESMTYGSVMATLGALCVFCLNPRLVMRGLNRTKHLASRFDEEVPAWSQSGKAGRSSGGSSYTRRIKLWYDDCVPADPQQVNSDVQLDFQCGAITTNELRALRGRAPYEYGGDDPMVQGAGGLQPMPLNTGHGLDDLASLIAPMTEAAGKETGQQQLEGYLAASEQPDPAADASTPAAAPEAPAAAKGLRRKSPATVAQAVASLHALWESLERTSYAQLEGAIHGTVAAHSLTECKEIARGLGLASVPGSKVGIEQKLIARFSERKGRQERGDVIGEAARKSDPTDVTFTFQEEWLPKQVWANLAGSIRSMYRPFFTGGTFNAGLVLERRDGGGITAQEISMLTAEIRSQYPKQKVTVYSKDWDSLEDGGEPTDPPTEEELAEDGVEKGALETVESAGRWLAGQWAKLEGRYGRKTALAMAVGMIATSPLPGNLVAIVAAAEAARGIAGYFQRMLKRYEPGRRVRDTATGELGRVLELLHARGGWSATVLWDSGKRAEVSLDKLTELAGQPTAVHRGRRRE